MYIFRFYPTTNELTANGRVIAVHRAIAGWDVIFTTLTDLIQLTEPLYAGRTQDHPVLHACIHICFTQWPLGIVLENLERAAGRPRAGVTKDWRSMLKDPNRISDETAATLDRLSSRFIIQTSGNPNGDLLLWIRSAGNNGLLKYNYNEVYSEIASHV